MSTVSSLDSRVEELLSLNVKPAHCPSIRRELFRYLALVAASSSSSSSSSASSSIPNMYSPSPEIDKAWHSLLLDPELYYDVCSQVRNVHNKEKQQPRDRSVLIGHNPKGALDPRSEKRKRYESTLKAYKDRYIEDAPSQWWPKDYAEVEDNDESRKRARKEKEEDEEEGDGLKKSNEKTPTVGNDETPPVKDKITITLKSHDFKDTIFIVSSGTRMASIFEAYANKKGFYLGEYKFTFEDGECCDIDFQTVAERGISDGDTIFVEKEERCGC
jgi:hypothetical protein